MQTLVILLIIVIILGALLGGKSFGGTVRKGCGFLILLIIIIAVAIGAILYSVADSNNDPDNNEAVSRGNISAYFIVKQDCRTYTSPDIESDSAGYLVEGTEILVRNISKYRYFYEVPASEGKTSYVLKECLIKK